MREVVGAKGKVFGIEITPEVFDFGKKNLEKNGYAKKVSVVLGDGSFGLASAAPFDRIVSSAAAKSIPVAWIDQLREGGVIVAPIDSNGEQNLVHLKKTKGRVVKKVLGGVEFVPLTGG
jgi:protein-L-isoaspartate(D-aspartate) O-methyltransferase